MIRKSGPMWPWAIIILVVVMFLGAIKWNSDEFVGELRVNPVHKK